MQARKRYFDEDVPDDVQAVLDAAAVLGVGEFQLFQIAYRWWHGEDGEEKTVERYFIPYMFQDIVPMWVRHLAHEVQRRDRAGRLDPADYGIVRRTATRGDIRRGRLYAFYLVVAIVIMLLLAELTPTPSCMFPPCY